MSELLDRWMSVVGTLVFALGMAAQALAPAAGLRRRAVLICAAGAGLFCAGSTVQGFPLDASVVAVVLVLVGALHVLGHRPAEPGP